MSKIWNIKDIDISFIWYIRTKNELYLMWLKSLLRLNKNYLVLKINYKLHKVLI